MATPFEDIYERAVFQFADHDFLKQDVEVREYALEQHLKSAKTEFKRICKTDLGDCDFARKCFNQTLSDEEVDILALGVAFHWLSYRSMNSELLKNVLNSRDYYYYSPANLLKEVKDLRKTIRAEYLSKIRQYSYLGNTISTLKA